MKKNTLVVLWIAVSLMFFGGILAVSTYAISGGNIGVYYQNGGFHSDRGTDGTYSNSHTRRESAEFSDISSLDINADIGEIKIAPGDTGGKFIVDYSYPSNQLAASCNADNGVIKFTSRYKQKHSFNFNIFGFSPRITDDYGVTITYPKGTIFRAVNISSSIGDIGIEKLEADRIDIKNDLGQIYCDSIITKSFTSSTDVGNTHIVNSQLGKAEIETNLGEFIADSVTTSSLDISSDGGNIDITGALSGKTEVENNLGNISVKSTLPRTSYNLELEVELGTIRLDGQHEGNNVKEHNGAENTMELQSDAGSISLDFK